QYQALLAMDGIELEFTDDALDAIADKAIARGTGARGLRAIMESVLLEWMYRAPSMHDVEKIVINREAVEGTGKPVLVRRGKRSAKAGGH
ncbi:MAG: hypothetical protein D6771_02545, partial [Zetaproteobacteria bacterium]